LKFAVLGSASADENSPEGMKAFKIGRLVASAGAVLLTGGCPGLPHAAVRGALQSGGLTVAVSPAANKEEHRDRYGYPLDSSVVMFTGMGTKGRNVILVRSSDACIFVGGGMGTLNEFTIAFDDLGPSCCIGIVTGTGGLSDEFTRLAAIIGRVPPARVLAESDPVALMEALLGNFR
jgi:uncharacterized protein (TIGR00725 family)